MKETDYEVPLLPSAQSTAAELTTTSPGAVELLRAFATGVSKHERMGIVRILESQASGWLKGERRTVAGCAEDIRVLARMLAKV